MSQSPFPLFLAADLVVQFAEVLWEVSYATSVGVREEPMAIIDEQIESIMEILTKWNPLGDGAEAVTDLDNYRTEATDILAEIDMSLWNESAQTIVKEVLNQAFGLSLTRAECKQPAREIQKILQ